MHQTASVVNRLRTILNENPNAKDEVQACLTVADWTPPYRDTPLKDLDDLDEYLTRLLTTTPTQDQFSDMFHGIYYIISQRGNQIQTEPQYAIVRAWLNLYSELYGSFLNTPASANDLDTFLDDPGFRMENFHIPPGGFNSWNTFFSRFVRSGKRPIGSKTMAYDNPSTGLAPNPEEDTDEIHKNMCDDRVITVPADSVFQGSWPVSETDTVTVSKGNTYSIQELLKNSKYADRFRGGMFTHSYLSVLTYHRYHVPVRGTILDKEILSGDVYAAVSRDAEGHLSASDKTGYQFRQERGLMVIDSPIGLVGMLPIGMDVISSVNITVDEGDYVNKGDEFGNFLFGGSDMIMLFERNDIDVHVSQVDKLYKLGQVFGKVHG
jgi:phosphatidylserine decarboxylase